MLTTTSTEPGLPARPGCGDLVHRPPARATDTVAPKCWPWLRERAACTAPPRVQTIQSRSCASSAQRHVRVAARERAAEVDAVAAGWPLAERDDREARRVGAAGRPREERVAELVRDERHAVGVLRRSASAPSSRAGAEVRAEPLVEERPVGSAFEKNATCTSPVVSTASDSA